MKKLIYISIILALFTNCEDVIVVDLNNVEPKLVIEASINYFKNTTGNEQTIKADETLINMAISNLIENAIKYSEDEVIIELNKGYIKIVDYIRHIEHIHILSGSGGY